MVIKRVFITSLFLVSLILFLFIWLVIIIWLFTSNSSNLLVFSSTFTLVYNTITKYLPLSIQLLQLDYTNIKPNRGNPSGVFRVHKSILICSNSNYTVPDNYHLQHCYYNKITLTKPQDSL